MFGLIRKKKVAREVQRHLEVYENLIAKQVKVIKENKDKIDLDYYEKDVVFHLVHKLPIDSPELHTVDRWVKMQIDIFSDWCRARYTILQLIKGLDEIM